MVSPFQEMLIQRRRQEQLIFITGHGDIPMCAKAMKAGALDFLPKPIKSAELLKCVDRALQRSAEQRERAAVKAGARDLLDSLTPREFEVMELLLTGMLNKQVGAELNIAEKTVKLHRGRIMHKIGVDFRGGAGAGGGQRRRCLPENGRSAPSVYG